LLALNLNLKYFTPSLLLALDDQILPHAFLKMCLDSYVPEALGLKPESDPFISPTYACDEVNFHSKILLHKIAQFLSIYPYSFCESTFSTTFSFLKSFHRHESWLAQMTLYTMNAGDSFKG